MMTVAWPGTFGFGPYSFLSGSLSSTVNTSSTRPPIRGTNAMKYHQPLLPMSCNRRTVIDSAGMKLTTPNIPMDMAEEIDAVLFANKRSAPESQQTQGESGQNVEQLKHPIFGASRPATEIGCSLPGEKIPGHKVSCLGV